MFPFEGFTSGRFCPTPPKLSYSSFQNSPPKGTLESDNIYITEHILRTADAIKPDVFFRRFQAGFSLARSEPSFSVCGCNTTEEDVCDFISPLRASSSDECPRYSIDKQCALNWTLCYARPQSCRGAITDNCRSRFGSEPSQPSDQHSIECNESLSFCSTVEGLSADILQVGCYRIKNTK